MKQFHSLKQIQTMSLMLLNSSCYSQLWPPHTTISMEDHQLHPSTFFRKTALEENLLQMYVQWMRLCAVSV